MTAAERFWAKVDNSGDCWLWTGSRLKSGYGNIIYNGKVQYAHRVSWQMANGEIPAGMCVCHHCDTPRCVRPSHLFIGTQAENVADRDRKARRIAPRGEASASAKLTDIHVRQIRDLRQQGFFLRELAAQFGVGVSTVHRIVTGESR